MLNIHESSFLFYRLLLLAGWVVAVAGGFMLDQYTRVIPFDRFHKEAGIIFIDAGKNLDAYQEMMDVPYDRFQEPGIIAKAGLQAYLNALPNKPYAGRVGSMRWLQVDPADTAFCRKWGDYLPNGSGEIPRFMIWHLLVPEAARADLPLRGKQVNRAQAKCAGALEAEFDMEQLFSHVFKAATDRGMGVRIDAYGPTRANPDRNSQRRLIFLKAAEGAEGDGAWAQQSEFDFYTFRLRISLSAPLRSWNGAWPGLAFFTFVSVLSWSLYRWLRRRDERRTAQRLQERSQELGSRQRREDVVYIRHELAQPLTGISGCLESLLMRLDKDDLPKEVLERDLRGAFRFTQWAMAFLGEMRERISGQVEWPRRNVAMAEVFREVAGLVKSDPRFHGIDLSISDGADLRVAASLAGLEMVLLNLLRNSAEAIHDEGRGGSISLWARAEGDGVKIRVEDDGPGIAQPEELFVPFKTTKSYGTGLGLVHCKSLVESFGGGIKGGNRMGGGAWFEIVLPRWGEESEERG
jgi:signal transduction histidine kinase